MAGWICATCGNHYPDSGDPPASCVICADERQWVPPSGQRWTTQAELDGDGRRCEIWPEEPGLLGLGVTPSVGIGQRNVEENHIELSTTGKRHRGAPVVGHLYVMAQTEGNFSKCVC